MCDLAFLTTSLNSSQLQLLLFIFYCEDDDDQRRRWLELTTCWM